MTDATRGGLFVVSAPSGGGKTSLTRALVPRLAARGVGAAISISYTTRPARAGEQNGVHYHFVDEVQFEQMVQRGEFLEHAHVFGRRYGTGQRKTEELLAAGQDVILDIDWQGGRQVRKRVPEAVGVFILPPSVEELERRLRSRSQDSEDVIAKRMAQARDEMSHYAEYDYVLVNQEFERALDELASIFMARRLQLAVQQMGQGGLINALLAGKGPVQ